MGKLIDLTGNVYGRLTVVERATNKGKDTRWLCTCECGVACNVFSFNLKRGKTKSCGCLRRERTVSKNQTHGMYGTPSYICWADMKTRCLNKRSTSYNRYGGRGISVCKKWLSFEGFYEDMGDRPNGLTLDRKDNNGDYELSNCRWATDREQVNNRSNTIYLEYEGRVLSLSEWAEEVGIKYSVLYKRIKRGWSVDEVLETVASST